MAHTTLLEISCHGSYNNSDPKDIKLKFLIVYLQYINQWALVDRSSHSTVPGDTVCSPFHSSHGSGCSRFL